MQEPAGWSDAATFIAEAPDEPRGWSWHASDAPISARLADIAPDRRLLRLQHKTVRAVTEGIENLRFNTSIAKLMELVNALNPMEERPRSVVQSLVLLLAPFAPHLREELWRVLGHGQSLACAPWPIFDADLALTSSGTMSSS